MKRLELITDLGVIRQNALEIRRRVPEKAKLLCVVKADAYGHGAVRVAEMLEKARLADMFAVATPGEGTELVESGITKPIVVLGQIADESDAETSVQYGLSQAVDSLDAARILNSAAKRAGRRAKLDIKIDTGMSRTGVLGEKALDELLSGLKTLENIEICGLFTHFCAADEDEEFTRLQADRFESARRQVFAAGYKPLCHAAASTAMLNGSYAFDMVRAGIALYGTGVEALKGTVRPAQTLITHPVSLRCLEAGQSVGYGRRFTARRDSLIATVPCGYGDGYPRLLSSRAEALVNGKRVPVAGNVCMDMLMLDVTGAGEVNKQTPVVLLGAQGDEIITPDELAEKAETIPYEIMLGFSDRVDRSWINA